MAVTEMLERRLPRDSAQKVMLWGDSLLDYTASSNQRLRPPADILDRGLDLSLVDFRGACGYGGSQTRGHLLLLTHLAQDIVTTVY